MILWRWLLEDSWFVSRHWRLVWLYIFWDLSYFYSSEFALKQSIVLGDAKVNIIFKLRMIRSIFPILNYCLVDLLVVFKLLHHKIICNRRLLSNNNHRKNLLTCKLIRFTSLINFVLRNLLYWWFYSKILLNSKILN